MTCDPLASTGPGVDVGLLLILAVALLVVGATLLVVIRQRTRMVAGVLVVILTGAAASITAGAPGRALADGCPPANNYLTVVQTSVTDHVAPGSTPVTISGIVRNNGTDSTYIRAIDVKITGVHKAPGAVIGRCDASDYFLLYPLMPVGRTLGPGDATAFRGASIGLRNTSVNQDACKGALVALRYSANPI